MSPSDQPAGPQTPAVLLDLVDAVADGDASGNEFPAWQQVDTGRYMPRRVRGSYRGGVLGWTFALPPGPGGTIER